MILGGRLTVVILTFNEAIHIGRAIGSVADISDNIYVVDSGSNDCTVEIAKNSGAEILVHPFVTQAKQFNWALDQLPSDTDWILRLDADEYVTPELSASLISGLKNAPPELSGFFLQRRMKFLGREIRHGGVFPVKVLRVFRYGHGRCENRWMDEHIIVGGEARVIGGELIDDNLNPLGWWIDKHNTYASREVVDILNLALGFMPDESSGKLKSGTQSGAKRWIKEHVYVRLPGGIRAAAYFFYRYIIRLGFLDGREGAAFHVLQGLWYRFLVDVKLFEVRKYMHVNGTDAVTAIEKVLGIRVK